MHPDQVSIALLSAIPERIAKHMKMDELRSECKLRRLDVAGLKKDLVKRLSDFSPYEAAALAGAAAAAARGGS